MNLKREREKEREREGEREREVVGCVCVCVCVWGGQDWTSSIEDNISQIEIIGKKF